MLITGFYSTGKIRKKKLINLIGNTTLYSIILTVIALLFGYVSFNKKMLIKTCFPLLFGNNYWFIVVYLELYVLSPLLNTIIKSLDAKSHKKYILFFTCLLCIIPTIIGRFIQTNEFGYSSLIWFIYMYFIGAYLRLYVTPKFHGQRRKVFGIISGLVLVQIIACIGNQVYTEVTYVKDVLECLADYNMNAIMPLLISTSMFLFFHKIEIHQGKNMIEKIGAATIGVYLFHDNANFRMLLWNVCSTLLKTESPFFILYSIICVIIIFMSGIVIEITRKFSMKKICNMVNYICRRKNV